MMSRSLRQPECTCFFREVQRFSQVWLYVLMGMTAVSTTCLFGCAMFKQLVQG